MNLRSFATGLLTTLGCLSWFAMVAVVSCYSDGPSLFRTLALGISAALIAIPVGALLSWLMRHQGWVGRLATVATAVLLFFPLFLHVSLWDAAFGKLGWLTSTRGEVLTPIVSGWTAATWIHGIAAAPQVAVIFWLGRSTDIPTYEEQALLDASTLGVLFHVKLNRLMSLSLLAMAWVIVCCSREIAVTDIYQIGTLAEQIYLGYSLGSVGSVVGAWSTDQLKFAREFTLGPSLIPIACVCLLFTFGFVQLASEQIHSETRRRYRPAGAKPIPIACGVFLMLLLIAIPFANVLYRSGYLVRSVDGSAVGGFSFDQMQSSMQRAMNDFGGEFFWSTTIASVTSTVIVVFATSLTWLAIRNVLVRLCFIFLLACSLALPGPLIGTSIADFFGDVQSPLFIWLYDRTIFAPLLATTIYCWPLAGMLLWFVLSQSNIQTLQSVQIDGGTRWSSFWHLGVIRNLGALAGIWLLTFALSFGELSASQLVLPPGMDTLPRLMLGLLHAGVDEMTAAIAILIAAIIFVLSLIAYGMIARQAKHHQ